MKQGIDVIMNTVYMKITDKETEMTNTQQKAREAIGTFLTAYFAKK